MEVLLFLIGLALGTWLPDVVDNAQVPEAHAECQVIKKEAYAERRRIAQERHNALAACAVNVDQEFPAP